MDKRIERARARHELTRLGMRTIFASYYLIILIVYGVPHYAKLLVSVSDTPAAVSYQNQQLKELSISLVFRTLLMLFKLNFCLLYE